MRFRCRHVAGVPRLRDSPQGGNFNHSIWLSDGINHAKRQRANRPQSFREIQRECTEWIVRQHGIDREHRLVELGPIVGCQPKLHQLIERQLRPQNRVVGHSARSRRVLGLKSRQDLHGRVTRLFRGQRAPRIGQFSLGHDHGHIAPHLALLIMDRNRFLGV